MFAANPPFARHETRIFFDMLESLRRASVFTFQNLKPYKTLNPELTTLNPENLKSKLLRVVSVFIHPLVTGCVIWGGRTMANMGFTGNMVLEKKGKREWHLVVCMVRKQNHTFLSGFQI